MADRWILSNYDDKGGTCDCYGTPEEPCWGVVHLDESQCFCEYCDYRMVCQGHDGEDDYNKSPIIEEPKEYNDNERTQRNSA